MSVMKLYKYMTFDVFIKFIKSSSLKLTPFFQLNDPFELKLSKTQKEDWDRKVSESIFSHIKELSSDRVLDEDNIFYGVMAFSKNKGNVPMFAYYAEEHKGVMLEFTVNIGNEIDLLQNFRLKKSMIFLDVSYETERTKDIFKSSIKLENCNTKHIDWSHEDEVRIVGDFRYADDVFCNDEFSIKPDRTERWDIPDVDWVQKWKKIINHSKQIFHPILKIQSQSLTGIYLGGNGDEEALKKICNLSTLERYSSLNGNIFKYKVSDNDFSLIEEKVIL